MKTFKATFNNHPDMIIKTLQDKKAATNTAITQSRVHNKVYNQLDLTFNQQRKNLISITEL